MIKITQTVSHAPTPVIPATPPKPPTVPTIPKPPTAPKPPEKKKPTVTINAAGQRVNERGQRVDKHGRAINKNGHLINEKDQLINAQGRLVNAQGKLIDEQGRLVNQQGRLVNAANHLIDKDGKLVNKEGLLVDKLGRPLDKNGKVARDKESAARGNNEPHESLLPPGIKDSLGSWQKKVTEGKDTPLPAPAKMTIAEVTERMKDAHGLIKSGVVPMAPGAGRVARDAAISAGITGVVSAPFNIAAYAGSTSAGEAIKASYLPAPLVPPTPIAGSTVPRSPEEAKEDAALTTLHPRINEAQVNAFTVTNMAMALRYGDPQNALLPSQDWSSSPLERLGQMEGLLDVAEEHAAALSDEYQVYFKSYLPEKKAAEGAEGMESRVETIERRTAAVAKLQKLVMEKLKEKQSAAETPPVTQA